MRAHKKKGVTNEMTTNAPTAFIAVTRNMLYKEKLVRTLAKTPSPLPNIPQ